MKLSRRNARRTSRGLTRRRKQRGGDTNAAFPKPTRHLYNKYGRPINTNTKLTKGVHEQIERELNELERKRIVQWHLDHNRFDESAKDYNRP